ncbi:MAG: DUF3108 domain-containing protein [Kiloniellaceae bacterium]
MALRLGIDTLSGILSGTRSFATAAGLLLAAAVLGAGPASAEPVSAEYQVYFGGFHVLSAEALWQRSPGGYRIAGVAETQGFIGWLNPWKGDTETRGRLAAGKAVPQRFESRGTSDDGEKLVRLRYDQAGGIAETLVQPRQDEADRYPLPADPGKGTVDPLSVIAGLSELLQAGGRCEGSFAVFDGRKRYDLTVTDAGETQLAPTDYSIYAGPARGCRLDYKLLGGHRIERSKYAETARERIVWVARPKADAPLIPVRLQIETAYGTVMGHLTGYTEGPQAEARLAD